jgi:hypothetical protein
MISTFLISIKSVLPLDEIATAGCDIRVNRPRAAYVNVCAV